MNNNDTKNGAYKKLEQIIEKAIKSETESVTLEYADEGLVVCFICGNTGIGNVIGDPIMGNGIIRLIVGMAKPKKSKIKTDSQGVPEVFLQAFDSGDEK